MGRITKGMKRLKLRHLAGIAGLALFLVIVGSAAYGTTALFGGVNQPNREGALPAGSAPGGLGQQQPATGEIPVKSRLVFPRRAELSFERAGEVSEILVAEGDRVSEGQVLARLNTDHFPVLEEELSRLTYQIVEARDNIKKLNLDYADEPALAAQREETVARLEYANTQTRDFFEDIDRNYSDALTAAREQSDQARLALEAAEDSLADALRDLEPNHQQVLAEAYRAQADAELALDQASQRLEDYKEELGDNTIRARDLVTEAELALDLAKERLTDYQQDLGDNAIRGQDRVAKAELALDLAKEQLKDFEAEHDRVVLRARTQIGALEDALDAAQAALTQFLRNPTRDLQAEGKPLDVAKLRSLQAAVALAEANLAQARADLVELEDGPDPLRHQELESNVTVAELNLAQATEDLAELEEGPDALRLQELESNVTVAELNLTRAKENLAELEEGPDLLILDQIETQVALAEVILSQANKFLNEQLAGPDRLIIRQLDQAVQSAQTRLNLAERAVNDLVEDGPNRDSVPLQEKEIATRLAQIEELYEKPDALRLAQIESIEATILLAQERMEDIREEMDETLLRAPMDGLVFLVNAEVDDRVNKYSRVLEIIDPRSVWVDGLVDGNEIASIAVGAVAKVSIDSLPGQELAGRVAQVGRVPLTERGVVAYPITITVDLPAGVEAPAHLSGVNSAIIP